MTCESGLHRVYNLHQRSAGFPNLKEPPQNARYQKEDTKQFPYSESTIIRSHREKFSCRSNKEPVICAPLLYVFS